MAVKQQFNPSTLKALYNPITKKAMAVIVPDDSTHSGGNCACFDAGETPLYYTIVFVGVDAGLNGIHKLTHQDGDEWIFLTNCYYKKEIAESVLIKLDMNDDSETDIEGSIWSGGGWVEKFVVSSGNGDPCNTEGTENNQKIGGTGTGTWCKYWYEAGCP